MGAFLGGDRATLTALKKLSFSPSSILDVGCGGGGFTQKLGEAYKKSTVRGIDISLPAIEYAIKSNQQRNVEFDYCHLNDIPPKTYDIVVTTLVCHHLNDLELIAFLKQCLLIAKKKVIINDLHRHPIAWGFFQLTAPILFKNRLITHDGSLSVKRAFIRDDWLRYLAEIGIQGEITWHFPFRWIVTIEAP